jgi:hypothetical protein
MDDEGFSVEGKGKGVGEAKYAATANPMTADMRAQ